MKIETTPVAFELPTLSGNGGGLPVYWYAVFAFLGFTVGYAIMLRSWKRFGLSASNCHHLWIISVTGGLWGARLWFCATRWTRFASIERSRGQNPLLTALVPAFGLTQHGGVLGVNVMVACYCRWKGLSWAKVRDFLSAPFAVGIATARIGCLLNGCCHGARLGEGGDGDAWEALGVQYPLDAYRQFRRIHGKMLMHHHDAYSDPVHATQLYECLGNLALISVVNEMAKRGRFPEDGQLCAAYVGSYGLLRLIVDFFRHRSSHEVVFVSRYLGEVNDMQILCFAAIVAGCWYLWNTGFFRTKTTTAERKDAKTKTK